MKALNYAYNNKIVWYGLVILLAIAITLQNILLGENHFWGGVYTFYNNYVIFKTSFLNLIHNQDLYAHHLDKHADLYKYSPTFALFMGLFYYLPDWLGLSLWNLFNALVFLFAITTLPNFSSKKIFYLILFVLFELVLSLQNCQTNSLIAGLTVLSFTSMEKGKIGRAAFYICCGMFIKIFMVVACLFFLFHPKKVQFILYMLLWSGVLFLLPAIIVGVPNLIHLYKNWLLLLDNDRNDTIAFTKIGDSYSIYRFFKVFVGTEVNKIIILTSGVLLLVSPLFLVRKYKLYNFRLGFLCAVLIWMVIFNHKAESPSYIIAMSGIGIWCLSKNKSALNLIIVVASLLFVSLFLTDLVPEVIRKSSDKALVKTFIPCVVFFLIVIDAFKNRFESSDANLSKNS